MGGHQPFRIQKAFQHESTPSKTFSPGQHQASATSGTRPQGLTGYIQRQRKRWSVPPAKTPVDGSRPCQLHLPKLPPKQDKIRGSFRSLKASVAVRCNKVGKTLCHRYLQCCYRFLNFQLKVQRICGALQRMHHLRIEDSSYRLGRYRLEIFKEYCFLENCLCRNLPEEAEAQICKVSLNFTSCLERDPTECQGARLSGQVSIWSLALRTPRPPSRITSYTQQLRFYIMSASKQGFCKVRP